MPSGLEWLESLAQLPSHRQKISLILHAHSHRRHAAFGGVVALPAASVRTRDNFSMLTHTADTPPLAASSRFPLRAFAHAITATVGLTVTDTFIPNRAHERAASPHSGTPCVRE
jgi:hypothetical protein